MSRPLTEVDKQIFYRLKVSESVLERAGLVRVDAVEAEQEFGVKLDTQGGIVMKYFGMPNGCADPEMLACRIRQDNTNSERKYLCPYGQRRYLYFAPCDAQWVADPTTDVLFTEAEKSALATLSWAERANRRMICVGLGGVYGWRGRIDKILGPDGKLADVRGPLPDLDMVRNRRCYVLFDSNVDAKPAVWTARKRFAAALREKGATEVLLLTLPVIENVNGPDDFLGRCGYDIFFRVFESAKPIEEVAEASSAKLLIEDLPEGALDGAVGEIAVEYLHEFPRAYSYPSLLANASALVADRAEGVRSNIYVVLTGRTHTGKTQAEKWARGILGVPESSIISTFSGSGEQFVRSCSEAAGNTRLFNPTELGHTLQKMAIQQASFAFIFTRAFDEDRFPVSMGARQGKKNELFFDCHLSMVGAIVDKFFEDLFSINTAAGYLDRCLLTAGPSGYEYEYRGPFPVELWGARFRNPSQVTIHSSVWDELSSWRKEDPTLGRIVEIGLRAAVICASFDRRPVLLASDLGPTKKLVDYEKRMRQTLQGNEGMTTEGKVTDSILRCLAKLEGEGITRRNLFTVTNAYRLGVRTAEGVLRILIANGTICEVEGKRKDSKLLYMPKEFAETEKAES